MFIYIHIFKEKQHLNSRKVPHSGNFRSWIPLQPHPRSNSLFDWCVSAWSNYSNYNKWLWCLRLKRELILPNEAGLHLHESRGGPQSYKLSEGATVLELLTPQALILARELKLPCLSSLVWLEDQANMFSESYWFFSFLKVIIETVLESFSFICKNCKGTGVGRLSSKQRPWNLGTMEEILTDRGFLEIKLLTSNSNCDRLPKGLVR